MKENPAMPASEDEGTVNALEFSLASDIVELVVLSGDEMFLQTLREAVGSARRLWQVPAPEQVSDLLLAGQVGILVLDVQILNDAAAVFIKQIKRQFPDLVVVVAGNRDAEGALAPLISAGMVYRFIHKPMSPGRAKSFADAAVKRFAEQRQRTRGSAARRLLPGAPRGWWFVVGAALAGVLALVLGWHWAARSSFAGNAGLQGAAPESRDSAAEAAILNHAAAALAANRLIEPPGDNALELHRQAEALTPQDPAALAGVADVHERLLARAENALLEGRLDEASVAIDAARWAGVAPSRISFLTAQLAKSREQLEAAGSPRRRTPAWP